LWTLDGFSVGLNSQLSPQDKAFIRQQYPGAYLSDQIRHPAVTDNLELEIDDAQLRSIVTRFGLPSTQLKRMLTTLEDKLTRSPDAPNLKVLLK
jgi:hypothetical protein